MKKFVFRLPNDTDRVVIIGQTGSGKTQSGLWQLSSRSYDLMPWIILDFKRDELIEGIPGTKPLGLSAPIPDERGIYIVRPHPQAGEDGTLDSFLMRLWEHENCGLFVDEGYMLGLYNNWFNAILTQGRSKRIPCIILTQRPKFMTTFAFSEAQYFQVFYLVYEQDQKRVQEYFPRNVDVEAAVSALPPHESLWYDVRQSKVVTLAPVPSIVPIYETFRQRLEIEPGIVEVEPEKRFRVL